jgi:AraC family transcriptional activator of pobA
MARPGIPRYLLYGEFGDVAADRFIHVETIAARSASRDWTIRPHAHGMLGHLLFVTSGGGAMLVDGATMQFGRAVLTVPVGTVHGFRFDPGTDGHVVTVADPLLRRLVDPHPALAALHGAARVLPLVEGDWDAALAALTAEIAADAPLAGLAGEALLQWLLVRVARLATDAGDTAALPRRAAALVAAYRAAIERHLRDGWTVADHARALATSPSRLRACCMEVAGASPIRLLHTAVAAEARGQLAYTDRGVAEIGYDLGFDDPAYFTRFFRRETGTSPAAWRVVQRAGRPADGAA